MMVAFAILMPTLMGTLLFMALCKKNIKQETIGNTAIGFGIGMGLVTYIMFLTALFDISFNLILISIFQITMVAICLFFLIRFGLFQNIYINDPRYRQGIRLSSTKDLIVLFLTIWLIVKFIFVFYENSIWPIHGWDSWTNWSSGAKYFFYEAGLNLEQNDEHFFGKVYRNFPAYPLHVTLMQVWVALCMGEVDEAYMKIWSAFFFIAIIGVLYFSVKRESNHFSAIVASLLLSGVPLLSYHGTSAYGDLPLSYYSLASTVCLWIYLQCDKKTSGNEFGVLIILGFFLGMCIWTKVEGLFFALANVFVLTIYFYRRKKTVKHYFSLIVPLASIALPWYLFLFLKNVKLGRGEFLQSGLHFEVFPIFFEQTFFSANFNIIFMFLFGLIIISVKRILKTNLKYLLASLVLVIFQYIFIYVATENFLFAVNMMALNRSILTFIPSMYFISALLVIFEIYKKDETLS